MKICGFLWRCWDGYQTQQTKNQVQRWMVMGMREKQKELAKVIEKYFGADAGYLDISCLDLARVIIEAGWSKQNRDIHWATEQAYKNGKEAGKPKWIPVTERLPENICPVLVAIEGLNKAFHGWYQDEKWWTVGAGSRPFTQKVTHWMPLPEPPKGE